MAQEEKQFLSCDWGTSSFRLRLIGTNPFRIVAEIQNSHGISSTHASWQQNGTEQDRFLFYASVIKTYVSQLEASINSSLSGVPVVLSGMASSTLGMINLPYKQIPFKTDGSDLEVSKIKSSPNFQHDVIIISGVCSDVDVMRGEETQLVGSAGQNHVDEQVYIFPGTHSKHIAVQNNMVTGFKTYMTGEIFALLTARSTLTEAVQGENGLMDAESNQSFSKGVRESFSTNLLHSLFRVRTQFLLQKYPVKLNRSYLSGLLIGYEVKDLIHPSVRGITLVSSSMSRYYQLALQLLQVPGPIKIIPDEEVTVRGQLAIVSRFTEPGSSLKAGSKT